MLLTARGNRRETVCPACSRVYKRDARHPIRAGLTGGKGVPETIAAHPCVFATFTAPSFGPVHSRQMRTKTVLPCRPRRDANARRCRCVRGRTCFGHGGRARLEHRRRQRHPEGERDPWGRPLDETVVLALKTRTYDGTGHAFAPAAELALASATGAWSSSARWARRSTQALALR